jgi:hypothetical protein
VARNRAALAEALRNGPAAGLADARDRQRHLLCHAGGMPVAAAAYCHGGRSTAGATQSDQLFVVELFSTAEPTAKE